MDTTCSPPRSSVARVVTTVSIAFVVTQLDVTIVNVALVRIGADLHANVARLQWIVDAYTLAFAGLMLSAGALGDRFGARRLFIAGLAVFALASLACGLAADPALLIAARAVQGLGAAAMLPNSLALLNHACAHDPRLRARAVGWWTASGAIAIAAGPVIGGALIGAFGWRSIFLVNLPICAAGLAAAWLWIDAPRANPAPARGLDLPGQCLAAIALTLFTGAVIDWHPLLLGIALAAALAFVLVERSSSAPMVPPSLFRQRTFSAAVLFGVCMNLSYYGIIFVLSLYLQRVRHDTPLQAGLAFLPLTGGFLVSNVASGWATARYGARRPMIVGALLGACGFALLRLTQADTSTAALLAPFLLIPAGMGLAVPAMTTTVLASVERARAGTASAVLNTARQAGGAIGVAAFGVLAGGTQPARVVAGLHLSALASAGLLLVAAALACAVRAHPSAPDAGPAPAIPD
ncbi:MFS transporter [Burkholderia alba]|uniref:MFS transporter n=1 Tax=Burkholderia alba TaxID=2683677 RepID=UPI002B05E35D|nr:MFS transporter [Burkholderia alba]